MSLRIFSKIFVVLVAGLVLLGALVTSHDAGLTVPDWPTSFGENMFLFPPSKWKGGIWYEHVHRLYASVVGALTVILVIWTFRVEKRRWVKLLTLAALGVVIVQGLLGGITVLYLLPTAVSASHGTIGQTFFALTLVIAYAHSREIEALAASPVRESEAQQAQLLFRRVMVLLVFIYAQLIIAAVMRHSGAGLAFVDFPTHAGHWVPRFSEEILARANELRSMYQLPPVETFHLVMHALHRLVAYLITALVFWLGWNVLTQRNVADELRQSMALVVLLVSLQMMLGIATVASIRSPWVTSVHVLGGALILVSTVLLLIRSWVLSARQNSAVFGE